MNMSYIALAIGSQTHISMTYKSGVVIMIPYDSHCCDTDRFFKALLSQQLLLPISNTCTNSHYFTANNTVIIVPLTKTNYTTRSFPNDWYCN